MPSSNRRLTATSAALRRAPVAKAFMAGDSNRPTSGIARVSRVACAPTASSSQCSVAFCGTSITLTPIEVLAIHLESARERNAPPKPNSALTISRSFRLTPRTAQYRSRPRSSTMDDGDHREHGDIDRGEQDDALHAAHSFRAARCGIAGQPEPSEVHSHP